MLDPIVNFFTRIFQSIGRGIGLAVGAMLWPFMSIGRWYTERGWILRAVLGAILLGIISLCLFLLEHAALGEFQPRLRFRL